MLTDLERRAERWRALKAKMPAGVRLLAVSKGHPAAPIRQLAQLGQVDFGESRVQEALPKQEELADLPQIRWHFIGRLQANKVRSVVRAFAVIHSIDSLALAKRVDRITQEERVAPECFLQVKLRPDPTKGGWELQDLAEAWTALQSLQHLRIKGLMTMAPLGCSTAERRALFGDCRNLANQLGLTDCSMGMSGDWEDAAAAGATWVRVGSALFGPRSIASGPASPDSAVSIE
ncbi:MAG: YggS family pyridoxal phosphate-dependent enzyme [Synechococcus sp.]|nr:YggS family pyridoxal phosphate-dependent enzyme [Synechococcus sp.]